MRSRGGGLYLSFRVVFIDKSVGLSCSAEVTEAPTDCVTDEAVIVVEVIELDSILERGL